MRIDCDGDTVLLRVDQVGPACHTGTHTCFDTAERLLLVDDEALAEGQRGTRPDS
jgi:phosphoribosyl-AMP cyclohydrolase